MLRTIVRTTQKILELELPNNYIGKNIEVIAFPVDEMYENIINKRRKKKVFTVFEVRNKSYKFSRYDANER